MLIMVVKKPNLWRDGYDYNINITIVSKSPSSKFPCNSGRLETSRTLSTLIGLSEVCPLVIDEYGGLCMFPHMWLLDGLAYHRQGRFWMRSRTSQASWWRVEKKYSFKSKNFILLWIRSSWKCGQLAFQNIMFWYVLSNCVSYLELFWNARST